MLAMKTSRDSKNPRADKARVADIMRMMESWAPAWTAESWDRVGLMAGSPGAGVEKAWVALEFSESLLNQALAQGVDLLLLHHPPIFKPIDNLRTDNPATKRLIRAAASGLAVFAAHTNLDSAPGGVNDALADRLDLKDTRPLAPLDRGMAKLVVFIPPDHLDRVAEAVFAAGGGRIGDYSRCAFEARGMGSFLAPAKARPFSGRPGEKNEVEEVRWETFVSLDCAARAVSAMAAAHPYEEPAYDLHPLKQGPKGCGLGRVGRLDPPMPGEKFTAFAARRLGSGSPALAGAVPEVVEHVAVMGGSGSEFMEAAASAGADIFLTGEARHHDAEKAEDLGLCLLVLGHYETEEVVVGPWARRLQLQTEAEGLACDISAWAGGRCPWRPVKL